MFADENKVKAMLESKSNTLHRRELNDCFYDPNKSLCRNTIKLSVEAHVNGESTPLFGSLRAVELLLLRYHGRQEGSVDKKNMEALLNEWIPDWETHKKMLESIPYKTEKWAY